MLCPLCQSANVSGAAACATCGNVLGSVPLTPGGNSPVGALPSGAHLKNGDYELGSVLGQGGFGITYRGTDTRLGRPIAIKEYFPQGCALRIAFDDRLEPTGGMSGAAFREARERFIEEARVVARFNHHGIVKIYDFFEEKNTAYLVMEFLAGKTLANLLEQRGTLPESESVGYIEKVGSALAEVHQSGLLHRDVKPENIIVCDDHRVVLCDFGTARSFTGKTINMEAQLTIGYAPLEQYNPSGRFGSAVDIHALGATLYHLLTGVVPTPPTDRVNGIHLSEPHRLRSEVSRTVSDAVMWALEINASDRPASTHEFLVALRSTKTSPTPPRRKTTSPSSPPKTSPPLLHSPHEARLAQLRHELENLPKVASVVSSPRIQEIEAQLAMLPSLPPTEDECPVCSEKKLARIAAPSKGLHKCPLCRNVDLKHRQLDESLCAVCLKGPVKTYLFSDEQMFCPACSLVPLREEKRKKFGLVYDLWLTCRYCHSEWDVLSGGKARFVSAGERAKELSREWVGEVLPLADWKLKSGRASRVLRCESCQAQWDMGVGTSATLVHAPRDPNGVGAKYLNKTFFQRAWNRLAHGLPLGAGDTVCVSCLADFHYDPSAQTLKWLSGNTNAWAHKWRGQAIPLSKWHFALAGKRSGNAGFLCSACNSEWDGQSTNGILVHAASGTLRERAGEVHTLADWHRLSRGHISMSLEVAIRKEQERLKKAAADSDKATLDERAKRAERLKGEMESIALESWREGFVNIESSGLSTLKPGETVRWKSQATMLRQKTQQGFSHWEFDREGTLVVTSGCGSTSARIFLEVAPHDSPFKRRLNLLRSAEYSYEGGRPVIVMHFNGYKKPTAVSLDDASVCISLAGRPHDLTLKATDLLWLLNLSC